MLTERFQAVDTTALCDVDKSIRVLSGAIRPRSAGRLVCGPAFTVRCDGDFLAVLRAVETAKPGEVIVVEGGGREVALGGELFARGALARGLGGIIVDGGYRDLAYVSTCPLPVYSRHITPMAGTATALGELGVPVTCGGVVISPGELILADAEGILVVEADRADALLDAAAAVKQAETRLIERLNTGGTLGDGLNLAEHLAALGRGESSALTFTG